MRKTVIILALTLLLTGSASAFNGMRKGFVIGGGLGIAPSANWSSEINTPAPFSFSIKPDENKVGLAVNLVIGYAWDEHNMIVYEGNVAGYNSDLLNKPSPRVSTERSGITTTVMWDIQRSQPQG